MLYIYEFCKISTETWETNPLTFIYFGQKFIVTDDPLTSNRFSQHTPIHSLHTKLGTVDLYSG